jgi:rubrerythrin
MSKHWTLDDIPWERFEAARVDPDHAALARAASMVEANAHHYTDYLCNVFAGDTEFCAAARDWALEEVQHGAALGKWATLVDPGFDFDENFKRFQDGFRIDANVSQSVRGSRSGELIARCMVETGTSSYYLALGDATEEPVLKEICRRIAADELRHYKLFYDHLKRYIADENLSRLQRLRIALSRIVESEDDELAYAYYVANGQGVPYDRKTFSREYSKRAYRYYTTTHTDRAMSMIFKACGLKPQSGMFTVATKLAWFVVNKRAKMLARESSKALPPDAGLIPEQQLAA